MNQQNCRFFQELLVFKQSAYIINRQLLNKTIWKEYQKQNEQTFKIFTDNYAIQINFYHIKPNKIAHRIYEKQKSYLYILYCIHIVTFLFNIRIFSKLLTEFSYLFFHLFETNSQLYQLLIIFSVFAQRFSELLFQYPFCAISSVVLLRYLTIIFHYHYNIICSTQIAMLLKKSLQISPQNCLTFISGKHNTVATITITLNNQSDIGRFSFKLKTTNKTHYKVSVASGDIDQLEYKITIYLKDFAYLQNRLKDSFMITIYRNGEQGKNILPLERRFKVQIQQENRSYRSDYPGPIIYQDDVSRVAASNYTTPSIVTTVDSLARNSCLPKRVKTDNMSVYMKKNAQKLNFNQTKILESLNRSRRELMDEKLKLKNLQDQIEIVKLKNRMKILLAIGMFIFMLFIGWLIGKHSNTVYQLFISSPPPKKWYQFY